MFLVLTGVLRPAPVRNDGSGKISQNPGTVGLNSVDEGWGEVEVGQNVSGGLVIEKGEQGPVDQPGAMLKLGERVVEEFGVDGLLDLVDFFHDNIPLGGQDVAGKLAPSGGSDLVVIGGKDAELIEEMGGIGIAPTTVLKAAVVVEHVNILYGDFVIRLEELEIGNLVAAEVGDDTIVAQQFINLARLFSEQR